ncbi:MAG: DUF305 domain-containing protein [Gemmatimonadales bacterium]|nr:DUF305 domain-containing protein [Gemmatimonadales bacterium]
MHRVAALAMVVAACSARAASNTADLEAIYHARADSARMRFTPADVRFMTGMIGHHRQALDMAALVPRNGASSSIETLAARIINAQQDEIATLEQWLRERDQPLPAGHEHAHMPGMLTPAQMAELAAARGAAFDRLFLRYMIQHHRGAVAMVHELFGTDGAAQDEVVFKLASDIQVDQITEIARMELMLEEMP